MPETHESNPKIQPLNDPKDPPDGGATADPNPALAQTDPPPRGDDDQQ